MGDRGEELRKRSEAKRQAPLAAIERVRSEKGRTLLEGRSRLSVALLVSKIFQQARQKGHRRDEIVAAISHQLAGHRSSDFRLEKWTLPRKIQEIDDEVVRRYRSRAEPQKDARVYIAIVEALAPLAELDREELLLELAEAGKIESTSQEGADRAPSEIEPADRLAQLLHAMARTVARRADLPNLWSRAARVQAGWNPAVGPVAKEIGDDVFLGRFSPKLPATASEWTERTLPPYPSVNLLRIPYGRLTTDICIEAFDAEAPDIPSGTVPYPSFKRTADFTAYWDLMLSVAPLGAFSVGAIFLRTSSVDLLIRGDGSSQQTIFPEEDIWSFAPNGVGAQITWNQTWRRAIIDPEKFAAMSADWAEVYRAPRSASDKFDELPPSHDLPRARIVPASTSSVQNWLVEDLRWKWGDRPVDVTSCLDWDQDLEPAPSTWFQGLSFARDVEFALHSGELERKLYGWIRHFDESLSELEQNWLAAAQEADRKLRSRWSDDSEFAKCGNR